MECREVLEHLLIYGDMDVESRLKKTVEEHLKVCSSCSKAYELHAGTWMMLDLWEDAVPPERLRKKILGSLQHMMWQARIKAVIPIAAGILLVLSVVLYYAGSPERRTGDNTAEITARQTADHGAISEEEVIANLDVLEDEEFFDALEDLVKIDYLPLMEELPGAHDGKERSSLEAALT